MTFNVPQAARRAHTRKLGAHIPVNVPFKTVVNIISYTSFQIQMSPGKMRHKRNYMRTQTLTNKRNIDDIAIS